LIEQGSQHVGTIPGGGTFSVSGNNLQLVKVGINYRFGWGGPLVANY